VKNDQPVEVLLPEEIFVTAEEGTQLSEQGRQQVKDLVLGITGEMLREGVELHPSGAISGGIRVRLIGEEVEIDLSDQALSELLLKHLLPRYRAIVTGVE
jgi:V/A-type H+-transporting ATPase subunit E